MAQNRKLRSFKDVRKGTSNETSDKVTTVSPNKNAGSTCMVCGKVFQFENKFKIHLRSHTGETPYTCTVCSRAFTQNAALKVHMRTHTGERPFRCKSCKKTFARADHLKQHTRTHTGEKPFTCSLCNKSFATWSAISRHKAEHDLRNNVSCQFCSRTFSRHSNLKSHLLRVHSHSGDSEASSSLREEEKQNCSKDVNELLETLLDGEDSKFTHFSTGIVKTEPIENDET